MNKWHEDEIVRLEDEVAHWKANHDNMVNRSRVLIDRPDLPLERVEAFKQLETLTAENKKLRKAVEEGVSGFIVAYFLLRDMQQRYALSPVAEDQIAKFQLSIIKLQTAAMTPYTKGESSEPL